MAGVEFTRFVVDIGTRILVSGAIGWMCFSIGLYFWDELSRRHLVRRRSRQLRSQFRDVKPTEQANRWFLEDDLCAYRCQCGNLWFGDEQAGYSLGNFCVKCHPENQYEEADDENRLEQIQEEEYQEPQPASEPEEAAEDYYERVADERTQLRERQRHAEEQGEYLQLASREG